MCPHFSGKGGDVGGSFPYGHAVARATGGHITQVRGQYDATSATCGHINERIRALARASGGHIPKVRGYMTLPGLHVDTSLIG